MNSDLKKIKKNLRYYQTWYTVRSLVNKLCVTCTVFFLFSAFLTVLFAFFPWVILPPVWELSVLLTIFSCLWKILDSTLFHPVSLHEISEVIEKRSSKPHMLPSISLELEKTDHSNSFVRETFRVAVEQLSVISRKNALPEVPHLPKVLFGGSMLLWMIALIFCRPLLTDFWKLPFTLIENRDISIEPGSIRLPLGSPATLKLIPKGTPLPSARISIISDNSQKKSSFLLRPDSSGSFKFSFEKLNRNIRYQFSYGATTCKPESIQVIPPPMIMGLRISATPPAYMRSETLQFNDDWGDILIPAGSDVSIKIISTDLSNAKLITSSDSLDMVIQEDTASLSLQLKSDLSYSFALKNVFDVPNDSLPLFHISVLPDESPFVQIIRPARNKALNVNQIETLWIEAVDDFGIQSLYCQWYTNHNHETASKKIGPQTKSRECRTEFVWDLKKQSLYPGDTLYYWIKVRDTRPDRIQESFSDTFTFRLPGFGEIHKNIAENGEYISDKISEVQNKQEKINNKLKNLSKSNTAENDELSWEQKQALQDVQKEFAAQADTLQKALDALKESVAKLKDEGVLNEDILSKMQEIEKTLKDLIAQYGDSLMKMPAQQDQQFSMNDMKEAIKKTEEMLPELESRLENTLKFLEMLKKDQELAMMAAQAEKFAKEQLDLKEQQSSSDFASKQKTLMDRIQSFTDTLKQKMGSHPDVASSLQKIDNVNQLMQMSIEQDGKPKSNEMSSMGSSLMKLSDQLRQQMSSEKMKQMQHLKSTLLSLVTDLFTIINWNAEIVINMKNDSDKEIALSHQALIQSTHLAQGKIDTLKALPPQLKQLLRSRFREFYRQSGEALQSTGAPDALYMMLSEEQALRDLTETVISILEQMSNQNNNSSSGGSMSSLMEQLQKLSGKQGAINSAVSDLLRSMMSGNKPGSECKNGEGDKAGGMSKAQAKARQEAENAQRELAEQLDQLAKKFGNDKSGEGSSMGKRMEELEKEARQLAEKLRNPPDTDLRDRQDRFLSRMLQATLSMHRQDEGKEERKSKSALKTFTSDSPGTALSEAGNNPDTFYSIRRRALESKFPPHYRTAIKAYFDSLGVIYLKK